MATRYNWLADTDSKAFEVLVELQRKMSAGDKLAAALQMAGMMLRAYEDRVRRNTRLLERGRCSCARLRCGWAGRP